MLLLASCGAPVPVIDDLTIAGVEIHGPQTVAEGEFGSFSAVVTYDDGTTTDITASVTWAVTSGPGSISPTGVYSAPGSVTGDTPVKISITYSEGDVTEHADKEITATATAKIPTGVAISGPQTVVEGGIGNYAAVVTYDDGSTATATTGTAWKVNSPGSITGSGVYCAPENVTSNVAVTLSVTYTELAITRTASKDITVSNVTNVLVDITLYTPNAIPEGDEANLRLTATYDDGSSAEVTTNAIWTVVSGGGSITTSGVYSAPETVTADTTVKIAATYTEGAVTRQASQDITILETVKVPTSLTISGPSTVTA